MTILIKDKAKLHTTYLNYLRIIDLSIVAIMNQIAKLAAVATIDSPYFANGASLNSLMSEALVIEARAPNNPPIAPPE